MHAVLAGTNEAIAAARAAAPDLAGCIALPVAEDAWRDFDPASLLTSRLILAAPIANGVAKRALLARAAEAGVALALCDANGPRALKLDDVLAAPRAEIDWPRIARMLANARILITGGAGSIGAALAQRIASYAPARLALLDTSDSGLVRACAGAPGAAPILADVRDAAAVARAIAAERPDIVFHAAALKQAPLIEAYPCEGALTNVDGLRNVAEAAHAAGADLIFVSTTKAVDPSGVMGATKRLGELYCQALDRRGGRRAIVVRLGNVLGSTGSVASVFEAQIAAGGPLTVTDPAVTRVFLSVTQAANALLHAAAAGRAASLRGAAFGMETGEALPVMELARAAIHLAGLRPGRDRDIAFTGLRPGEKLAEGFVAAEEVQSPAPAPGMRAIVSPPRPMAEVMAAFDGVAMHARAGAGAAVRERLFAAVAPLPERLAAAL